MYKSNYLLHSQMESSDPSGHVFRFLKSKAGEHVRMTRQGLNNKFFQPSLNNHLIQCFINIFDDLPGVKQKKEKQQNSTFCCSLLLYYYNSLQKTFFKPCLILKYNLVPNIGRNITT